MSFLSIIKTLFYSTTHFRDATFSKSDQTVGTEVSNQLFFGICHCSCQPTIKAQEISCFIISAS